MATRELPGKFKTKDELAAEAELEDFFKNDIGEGTITVKVHRIDPPYGYSGEFYVTSGNPLTLRELKQRFGGRVLRLIGRSSNGQFSRQMTITIDDVPRRDGLEIYPDGTVERPNKNSHDDRDPWSALMRCPLPPDVIKMIAPYMLGYPAPADDKDNKTTQGTPMEMMAMQMMMDFQNKQSESQLRQQRMSMEMEKDMWRWRKEMGEGEKPRDTLSGVGEMVKVMQELNKMKDMMGGPNEPLAKSVMDSVMPMAETMMGEYMQLKRMQLQMELSNSRPGGPQPAPQLQERKPKSLSVPRTQLRVVDETPDDLQMARMFGRKYRSMNAEKQQKMMNAFLHPDQNIEPSANNDTMVAEGDEYLDDEDREIMRHAEDDENEDGHISDSEHAGPADDNDPDNRQGDTGGGDVSAD